MGAFLGAIGAAAKTVGEHELGKLQGKVKAKTGLSVGPAPGPGQAPKTKKDRSDTASEYSGVDMSSSL